MPEQPDTETVGGRRVFFGFGYQEPHLSLYGTHVRAAVKDVGWEATMPLGADAQGLMLDRILTMIRASERAVYEVGVENGNVWFELGVSLGLHQPTAMTSGRAVGELPDLLRSAWLRPYKDDAECLEAIRAFLNLAVVPPIVDSTRAVADPQKAAVIGSGDRAAAIANGLRAAGLEVSEVHPAAMRSLADAVAVADTCGVVVAVRPAAGSWGTSDQIATLVALGAAYGLAKEAVLAAGTDESVPSDCLQLLSRGTDEVGIVAAVVAALARPRPSPPPTGTMRPRMAASIPRADTAAVVTALHERGSAIFDAEPGYGKTTLLDQVADLVGASTAWITVEADWSIPDLVERLVSAVGQHAPGFGWGALVSLRASLHSAGQAKGGNIPPAVVQPELLAEVIAGDSDRAGASESVLLVVDDVHKVSAEGGRFIARLISVAPQWLSVAVAGRGLPDALASMSSDGEIPSWRAEELRFTQDETSAFLKTSEKSVDDERILLIHERTQGWQAALAVIQAWIAANPDAPLDQLREMTRGDRHRIYRVFATDYFQGLPAPIRTDLFELALPIRIDPNVAIHLLGDDGGMRLRGFADGPYFLTEDEAGIFRFHSLFREFLGQRWIDERGSQSLAEARMALAQWSLNHGDSATAFEVGCEAEDWATAVAAIEPVIRIFANSGDNFFVLALLSKLPEERIRSSRPLWESWVRALSHSGDSRALAEAKGLAETATTEVSAQATAELLLAELRLERGEITDAEMAATCDDIANRIEADSPSLSLQARMHSLGARTIHNSNLADWTGLHEEAVAIAETAEHQEMPIVAAIALATAGDLAGRIFETTFSRDAASLQLARSIGLEAPEAERTRRAKQLIAVLDQSQKLFRRALELAESAGDPLGLAHVQINYARNATFQVINAIWREGKVSPSERQRGEIAISYALTAASTYSERGVARSVIVALNAAAEGASALNDRNRLNDYATQAEQLAQKYGYADLAETAASIRDRPTVVQLYEEATHLPPFHKTDPADLEKLIQGLMEMVALTQTQRGIAEPVLRRMMATEVFIDEQREAICRYLVALQDKRGPKVGPFEAADPKWSVTCRLLGFSLVERHQKVKPLVRRFFDAHCSSCPHRSPATEARDLSETDDDIYAPMWEHYGVDPR